MDKVGQGVKLIQDPGCRRSGRSRTGGVEQGPTRRHAHGNVTAPLDRGASNERIDGADEGVDGDAGESAEESRRGDPDEAFFDVVAEAFVRLGAVAWMEVEEHADGRCALVPREACLRLAASSLGAGHALENSN